MSFDPYAPYGTPIDLPSLDPIWAEAQELDLSAVLHTFTNSPDGATPVGFKPD